MASKGAKAIAFLLFVAACLGTLFSIYLGYASYFNTTRVETITTTITDTSYKGDTGALTLVFVVAAALLLCFALWFWYQNTF